MFMCSSASSHVSIPIAPAGYRPGYVVYHPVAGINVVAALVFMVVLPLLGILTLWLHGALALPVQVPLDAGTILGTCGAVVPTVLAHELIHGLVLRHYGYRVSYGLEWRVMAVYAGAFGQFQTRNHALIVALAPLVIISILMAPLLAVPNHYVVSVAFSVLLTNTPGAVGDVYLVARLLHLPRRSLLYDLDPVRMLVFVPACR